MPSNKPIIAVRTDETTIEKFKILCQKENRSMAKQAEKMIKDAIYEYETKYGTIKIESEKK